MAREPSKLIDRKREWEALERSMESDQPELITIVGRRRVGKSFLLTRFAKQHRGIYYQATRRAEADQLKTLSQRVGERFDGEGLARGASFADWEALLAFLATKASERAVLLVLDEFPYLATAAPALTSILQASWDHDLATTRIKLILCGSYISAMSQLTHGDQPLHGRRTAQLALKPFSFMEASRFVPDMSPRDRLRTYGIFGGLPGHLALLDPSATLEENAIRHVIDPRGRLFDEASHVLDAFLREATVHYSIVDAIAAGNRKWSRIASRVGKDSASLSRPLRWLREMGIVEAVAPVSGRRKPNPKQVQYRLADPYLRFWHRHVAPLQVTGTAELVEPATVWRTLIEPRLDGLMGDVFEDACRSFVARTKELPFTPIQIGGWWDANAQHEIDVVAIGTNGDLLLGECKWGPVGVRDLEQLQGHITAALPTLPPPRTVHRALFTANEVTDERLRELQARGDVMIFTLEAMFRGRGA